MKWYYLNDLSLLGLLPDSCVYWDVELVSPYKFLAKFYIYLPPTYLCSFDFVYADCKLFGNSASTQCIRKRFIQHGQKPFGYEDGNWWLVEYKFCLKKDIAMAIKFGNMDNYNTQNNNNNSNIKMNQKIQNYMELHLKLSNAEWLSSLAEWKKNGELNWVNRICDKRNQLLKYRINFVPNDINIVFKKDFMLCHLIKTTIIKCIQKLLSSSQNKHYVYNFDWLKILLQYIRLDEGKYCDYNNRYKNIKSVNNNKYKNSSISINSSLSNINCNVDSRVSHKVTKQKKQFKVTNKWDSKVEFNSELCDSLLISNSKYRKNRYKSSKIKKKYLNKKAKNRKHKMKKLDKSKDKHNFNKKPARNAKYKEYEYVIEEDIDDFYDVFHLRCSGCHECCHLTYVDCDCDDCREAYFEKLRLETVAERERELMLERKEAEERERELKLEMEWLEQYLIIENDYLYENITDEAFNVYLNEKYSNNCYKSWVITKNIANKRKNKDTIKIKKQEKMKRKKYFLKNTKKSKYKNKYPKKVNHFDF